MLQAYRQHAAERAALGIPPLPLDAQQVAALIEVIKNPGGEDKAFLMDLLTHRVPPVWTTQPKSRPASWRL